MPLLPHTCHLSCPIMHFSPAYLSFLPLKLKHLASLVCISPHPQSEGRNVTHVKPRQNVIFVCFNVCVLLEGRGSRNILPSGRTGLDVLYSAVVLNVLNCNLRVTKMSFFSRICFNMQHVSSNIRYIAKSKSASLFLREVCGVL